MKLSKCILLATIAISASFASANTSCQNAANAALTKNNAKAQQTAENLTGQARGQSAPPQDTNSTVAR